MSNLLSKATCIEILKKNLKHEFVLVDFTLENINSDTLGFLGDHLLLKIFYRIQGETREETFFVKCHPQVNENQEECLDLGLIRREVTFYKEIVSKLQSLVPVKFSPEFYFGKDDDVLVLENLHTKNFHVSDEIYLSKDKLKSVIINQANMHAASIIFEDSRSMLHEFQEDLTQNRLDYVEGHIRCEWRNNGIRCVAKLCSYFTGRSDIEKRVLEYSANEMTKFDHIYEDGVNVFCHNDLWGNNLMFNENHQCRFVDFQLAKYGPPAWDFLKVLYFNTEYNWLQPHLSEFINLYFDTFDLVLTENKIKSFSKKEFLETVELYKKPVFLEVCICCTYIFMSNEFNNTLRQQKDVIHEFDFVDRSKYIFPEMERDEFVKDRFRNIIVPLCEMFN
ncbi:uncharacterized protein LOC126744795 [Anthonomus grandis grandis]|uniref:uncharacterized protein LOC126744795 n=1 Tax=Anthonomus grandis grandis TaxID=2921223 RepID=UPI002165CD22|nr:uncharacterized protein LOC126744795 [Anthonomus grandis grandis]